MVATGVTVVARAYAVRKLSQSAAAWAALLTELEVVGRVGAEPGRRLVTCRTSSQRVLM